MTGWLSYFFCVTDKIPVSRNSFIGKYFEAGFRIQLWNYINTCSPIHYHSVCGLEGVFSDNSTTLFSKAGYRLLSWDIAVPVQPILSGDISST